MKQYKVCCTNITGVHGKSLLKDQVYPERDFMHLQTHINNGHAVEAGEIEDEAATVEEPIAEPAESTTKEDTVKQTGKTQKPNGKTK